MRLAVLLFVLLGLFMPAHAAKRVALVIGNSAYVHANPLPNPKNDAEDIAKKLTELGFAVTSGKDLDLNGMRDTVRGFIKNLEGAEVTVFYYAGHGLQVNGTNYMVPIDAKLATEDDVGFEAMAMETVLGPMERVSRTNLVFLDACRDNPLAQNLARSLGTRSAAVGKGLAQLGSGVGTLISFATQPGNVALDGGGRNSPFTAALLKYLGTPGQDITRDLVMVRRDVIAVTKGSQVPWDNSSLTGDVILQPDGKSPLPVIDENAADNTFWNSIKTETDPAFFERYIAQFPKGQFAELARMKLDVAKLNASAKAVVIPHQFDKQVASVPKGLAEPKAANPFDGYWSLTRIAKKAEGQSTCGWPSIESTIEIINGKIDDPRWKGSVDLAGKLQIMHYYGYDGIGDKGRMGLSGKLTQNEGGGKFYQIGGGCKGTLKLVRH